MDWWVLLLILGAVAMAVGPVMLMQPNSAQRYQEHLRAKALQLGLRVKVQTLPAQATDAEAQRAMPVYYLPLKPDQMPGDWLLVRAPYAHEAHLRDYWVWQGKGRSTAVELSWLEQILPQLPVSVCALGASPMGVGCYWTEQGGQATLLVLRDLLAAYPGVQGA